MQTMTLDEIRAVIRSLKPIEKSILLEQLIKEFQEVQPELVSGLPRLSSDQR